MDNIKQSVRLPLRLLIPRNSDQGVIEMYGGQDENSLIELSASVGSFLIDIYASVHELPKAPYYRTLEKRRLAKLAEQYATAEQIDLGEIGPEVVQALKSEADWDKVKLGVTYQVGTETRYEVLTGAALELFPRIADEILKICESSD